jgi:heavy metal sensor kinase
MQVSLRARLTAWYSLLLVLTIVVFSAAVLWLHWRLLLDQFDEALRSVNATANNVVEEELNETDLLSAAAQMVEVVRVPDGRVQLLDASGTPIFPAAKVMPLPPDVRVAGVSRATSTLSGPDAKLWRVMIRRRTTNGQEYLIAVGAPLDETLEQWRTLLKACLIGIPLALVLAVAGGLWLGRHGLQPLTKMAADAQAITTETLDRRLTVPSATTELERLATSFNHVLERLGSALATQRRFMADASHELRTPVSIMRTAADVTLSQPVRDEEDYREALATVSQQTSRLTRLVDDMLVLARADAGGYPVIMAPVDLTGVVHDCIRELSVRADDKAIAIRSELEPIALRGDEALLRRMLSNLLGNALTYTPRGGTVTVTLARSDDGVVLRVADTGPGIAPEDRERVFERFVRLDAARTTGGAGLGLAIARWVAEAHGGGVRILSSGPGGSVFAATLPV